MERKTRIAAVRQIAHLSWLLLGVFLLSSASFPNNVAGHARVGQDLPFSATLDGWTVTARRPEFVDVGEDLIVGKFTFQRNSGDALQRGGGACLVADLNDAYPCEILEDCLDAQARGEVKATPTGGAIYCQALNGQKHKRCWTRPSAEGCSRSPFRDPGTYVTPARSALVDGQRVMWMTLACLAAEGSPTGCASGNQALFIYASSPPFGR